MADRWEWKERHAIVGSMVLLLYVLLSFGGCARKPSLKDMSHPEENPPPASDPVCVSCHEEQVRFWKYGRHRRLTCSECHGEEPSHLTKTAEVRAAMALPGPAHCLTCHQGDEEGSGMIVGFEEHLVYIEKLHTTEIDRKRTGGKCISCHEPHLLE